jgi:hypothetical protein
MIQEATVKTLDAEFSDLQPWVPKWALDTEAERLTARAKADVSELREFYDAIAARLEAIIDHLNATPMAQLNAAQILLFQLAQMFFEVSLSVELMREPELAAMLPIDRLRFDIEGGLR